MLFKPGHAFAQINASRPSLGCFPLSPLVCPETSTMIKSPQDYELSEMDHVSYFTYSYGNASTTHLVSRDECKAFCLNNCTCKATFFRYGANISSGYCYLESTVYSLQMNTPSDSFYNSTAYIKFQRVSKGGNRSALFISVTVSSGLVVLFLLLGAWMAKNGRCNKEEKSDEREDEDASDNWHAGLTFRFSFMELENATNNFNTKLGSGGFGSLYEGVLSDGTKIAVKRLDRAGQGTKELIKMLRVGMMCIQEDFLNRPAMSSVVRALEGRTVELSCFRFSSSTASNHTIPFLSEYHSSEQSYTAESNSTLAGR